MRIISVITIVMHFLCLCIACKIEFIKYVSFSMCFHLEKKNINALNNVLMIWILATVA